MDRRPDAAPAAPPGPRARARRPLGGKVVLAEVTVNPGWVGRRITELEEATGARAAYLTRLGVAILPAADSVFQEGDLLHLAALAAELPDVERTLDAPPAVTEH